MQALCQRYESNGPTNLQYGLHRDMNVEKVVLKSKLEEMPYYSFHHLQLFMSLSLSGRSTCGFRYKPEVPNGTSGGMLLFEARMNANKYLYIQEQFSHFSAIQFAGKRLI
jgi:hypothetical protein